MLAAGLEGILRTETVSSRLLAPAYGTRVRNLDLQLARLTQFEEAEGEVGCIVLGSSTVFLGVDPDALGAAWNGDHPDCFVLGTLGVTAPAAAALGHLAVERYHSQLVVYGVTVGDVRAHLDARPLDPVTASAWIRYRRGEDNVAGWLIDHSALYRYALVYRQWKDPRQWEHLHNLEREPARKGFWPLNAATRIEDDGRPTTILPRIYRTTDGSPPSLDFAPLSDLAALRARGAQVVLVEMPLHPTAMQVFEDGAADYELFLAGTKTFAQDSGITFWRTTDVAIPADGWFDRFHLNERGARVLSAWLGERLARATRDGTIRPLRTPGTESAGSTPQR